MSPTYLKQNKDKSDRSKKVMVQKVQAFCTITFIIAKSDTNYDKGNDR